VLRAAGPALEVVPYRLVLSDAERLFAYLAGLRLRGAAEFEVVAKEIVVGLELLRLTVALLLPAREEHAADEEAFMSYEAQAIVFLPPT
jgi:hypothetical protein